MPRYWCSFTSTEQPTVQPGEGSEAPWAMREVREVFPTPLSPTTSTRTRSGPTDI